MKNFTKQNFKTNPLWIRLLIMTFMLLIGTGGAMAANTVKSDGSYRLYFKFSGGSTWWNGSGCYHYAWVWANGGAGQVQRIYKVGTTNNASTGNTTDVFYMNIPNGMTLYGMILFRGKDAGPSNGSTTFPSSYHNKTNDIILPNNISTYNLVTAVTENTGNVTQTSRYTTVSVATTSLTASNAKSGSGTQADPYVFDENTTMKLSASATIDDHNFQIQLAYGSSTSMKTSGSSQSIDVALTTAATATAYTVTYTPCLGGSTSYKGTASTKTIYYKTVASCTNPSNPSIDIDNAKLCSGASATITVTGTAEQFQLYTVSNDTYTAVGNKQEDKTFTVSEAKTYAVKAFNGTCESTGYSNTVSLTLETPSKIELASNPTICDGTEITLADYVKNTTVGTVTWYSNPGLTQVADATVTPRNSGTASTEFYYYAVAKNGVCDATAAATLTVTVDPQSKLTLKNTEITICSGTTVAFPDYVDNNNTIGTVSWYLDEDRTKSAGVTAKPSQTTTYYAKATSGDCTPAIASLEVTVNDKPGKPTLGASKTALVAGENATLTVSNTVTDATYTLYKDGVSTGDTGTSFTVSEAGSYTVKGKNDCGESDVSTAVAITVCNPIKSATLYFADSNYNKLNACPTYCAGSTAYFVLEYTGERVGDKTWTRSDNFATNLKGTEEHYYFTINTSGSISVTIPTCGGTSVTTNTLTYPAGNVTLAPVAPTVSVITNEVITCNETSFVQKGKIQITNYSANNDYIIGDNDNSPVSVSVENDKAYIYFDFGGIFTLKARNKACSLTGPKSAQFTITESDNAPTITGNNSIQPGGSTELRSDKGDNTIWKASGGKLSDTEGASVTFSADTNGKYIITAIYNDCETEFVVSVQDDLYVWMRRPIKKETAYTQFYHEDQNSSQGGDLYYLEFASKPNNYQDYNHGGVKAEKNCTDKEGYMWYGFKISKTAIENEYYFTVHAPNDGGKKGDSEKWGGFYTHTKVTRFDKDMTSDLYFVMDEVESGSSDGWNINAPVVVRASGDASFNGNNFADFVPLYVKDANTCTERVTSFEWQKADSENGTYTKYKSGEGINNIRTREAGWYRCKVTYLSGNTATSNAIKVTNTTSGTPGTLSFTSNLPIIMVNTNGVGFPDECTVSKDAYPSSNADKMKEKISVDVIIKKGDEILYDKKARMNYRGSSSLNFKKKSYAFVSGQDSCVFDKSRHDYVKTKKAKMLNILGVANYEANDKDWVLYAATADPSMIRNRLVFDLYQKMRPQDWGVHSTYVELVVDGEYKGVYVFMDKITVNEKRVNITNPNGFIVKWDKTDCADRIGGYDGKVGDEKTFKTTRTGNKGIDTYDTKVDQLFEIEYPEKEDIEDDGGVWSNVYQPIIDRFEAFEEALATKNYVRVRDFIDYDSWADWFILNEFTKNLDAYRASCIFTYSGAQGDKIKAVPLWDQELSFNNAAANISGKGSNSTSGLLIQNSGVYSDNFPAPFWFTGGGTSITGGLLNDPCFISIVKEKWATYTAEGGVLTSAKVDDMVDAYKADLGAISTAGTPIYRENAMIPFNNSTDAGRGATSSCTGSKAIGYFGYGKNCGAAVTHDNSITAIKNWIPSRITNLTSALNGLEGEALIFTFTPTEAETTPWVPVLFTVNAPQGYEYSMDYSKLPAGAVIKEGDNTVSVKLPQPANWPTGGDGTNLSEQYTIKAILEADGGTSVCGTTINTDKTSTITLKQTYEDCTP